MKKLIAMAVAACVVAVPAAASAKPADPVASIGSTTGTGKGGCVTTSKVVRFTLTSADGYYRFSSAKVTLDGKTIHTQSFALPASVSGGAAALLPVVNSFTVSVKLSSVKAGKHTLGLSGTVVQPLGRRIGASAASTFTPPGPPTYTNGKVATPAQIVKCAAPKKKPHYTG
jgi:hypothetical protein